MIFLTVGIQFPFDRLVEAVDKALDRDLINEEVFAQIGESSYKPRNFGSVASLEKKVFDKHFKEASSVISHAGMGTIAMALENEKPLLVMPRRKKYGEVVNDHQVAIAKRLGELGYFLVAYEAEELPGILEQLRTFVPRKRKVRPQAIVARIAKFLTEIAANS